jgi:hypothetical protein
MRLFALFSSEIRRQVAQSQFLLDHLVSTVDDFYERLGERNWIFHDLLSTKKIRTLLDEAGSAAEAEARFISLYQDRNTLGWWIASLRKHPNLQARMRQLRQARQHYEDGQFDSCTLHLIAVMDGFVNDFEPAVRKGLHAREAEDMTAWDSVVGHHLGLTHVMSTFNASKKKRVDDEVFEVFRNGIVHGSVVNFNNVVVATKAWNMLFAVADWASATAKAAALAEPQLGWRDALGSLQELGRRAHYKDGFTPLQVTSHDAGFNEDPIVVRARALLETWSRRQWGKMVSFLPPDEVQQMGRGQAVRMVKDTLDQELELGDWNLESIDYSRPYSADLIASATVNNEQGQLRIRFISYDAHGKVGIPGSAGVDWYVAIWAPRQFFTSQPISRGGADSS